MLNQQKRGAIHQKTQDLLNAHVSKIQTESALVIMARHQMLCFLLWLSLIHTVRTQNHTVCIFISAIAETHKNAGNDAFLKGDFVKAINLYTEGIEVKCKDEDLNAKLYNNRASAHYHLGKVSFILY